MSIISHPQPTYLQDYQAPAYLIDEVALEFYLEEEYCLVKSTLTVRENPDYPAVNHTLSLLGEELVLESIQLDDKVLNDKEYQLDKNSLTIFNVPAHFQLHIQTRIYPQKNTMLSGLYQSNGNFCTQCEAEGFRRITYFLDRPDVMASYTTKITADAARYPVLLSNGNLIDSGQLTNGKHWVKWQDPFKKPCYLFALVAGDLDHIADEFITQSGRKVTLQIYVEKGNTDKSYHAMQALKKAMRWDEENYGREYDLDIFMLVAVSDFNMGAMENKGLNIFNTKYILALPQTATDLDYIHVESVIAHEYFHNWTGNRITCRDWFQLSLKEGLTIFRDQSFTQDTTSHTVARIMDVNELRTVQFAEDAGPLAHAVRPESYIEINNFYTSTIYNKGAEVIRMLEVIVGKDVFRQGMDLYFKRYDGQAITIEDFVKVHEEVSGVDLSQFRLWYSQAGTPVLDIQDEYQVEQQRYTLKIKQFCPPTPGQTVKVPLHIPIKIGLLNPKGEELTQDLLQLRQVEEEFSFNDIPEKPIPSFLRDFSAPVKLKYNYSDDELALLFTHDTDLFNSWDAGQRYAVNIILRLMNDFNHSRPFHLEVRDLATWRYLLETKRDDLWLLSEMLTLPSEKYLAEQLPIISVESIHAAREYFLLQIATSLKELLFNLYQTYHTTENYEFNIPKAAARFLKNTCLSYLMRLNDSAMIEIAQQQFDQALTNNMTDTLAALRTFANTDCKERLPILQKFYEYWQHDALVVDKWFAIQASSKLSDTLMNVRQLIHHPAFDLKNPNKVYSLIGAFGHNTISFHAASGEGYQFLAETVLQLDQLNPQIAARMLKPLTDWKRYDVSRQHLMHAQLEFLLQHKNLSPDVYEVAHKSI